MKILSALLFAALVVTSLHAEPKKLLVVTTTTGFRHSSIPTLEKVIAQLGQDSGEFTVDLVQQPPGQPASLKKDATDEEKAAFKTAEAAWEVKLKAVLQKLSPESLKNYDGVVFASTTGDLPIPDKQGFLDWIKAGHAFIGIHAASDTFHHWPGYIDMLGGEFDHHGEQVSVDCLNQDPENPATVALPKTWTISQEEVYQFKNYDPAKVHELLVLDKKPEMPYPAGHFPVSWCKDYGAGKVFYTSLGHREDIIDADPDLKDRKNSVATSKAYQAHLLGGIEWALGLQPTTPVGIGPSFKGPLGLQLFSLRDQLGKDVPGALDKVRAMGFKYVELYSTHGLTPEKFRAELDARGLQAVSSHFPYDRIRDDVEGVARDAQILGLQYVGCAWIPHPGDFDEKSCREAIAVFNRAGAALAKHGLKFFYHTHGYEFQPFGQGTLFDLMMRETKPEFVNYQMDVFWVVHAGQDPVKLFEKYGSRWQLTHLKDMKVGTPTGLLDGGSDPANDVVLGTGQIDFPALLRAAQKAGVKWNFIEDESPAAEQQIPQSLHYLETVKW